MGSLSRLSTGLLLLGLVTYSLASNPFKKDNPVPEVKPVPVIPPSVVKQQPQTLKINLERKTSNPSLRDIDIVTDLQLPKSLT